MIIESINARQSFSQIAALDENAFFLDRAALTFALEEYPDLNVQKYLRRLDTFAARVEALIGQDRSPTNVIQNLNEVLFVQEGLRGDSEESVDPRNSYLNEVLDRKLGIPLSLSVIYMEVARRINFPFDGVGLPDYFLVKHAAKDHEIIVDVHNLGKILSPNECQDLLDKAYDDKVSAHTSQLQAMEKRAIITRLLYNLKGIYTQGEQYYKALTVIDRILMLNPGTLTEVRDRGFMYMQTSLFAMALADLEYYMAHATAPEDVLYVQGHIGMLRNIVSAVN